MRNHTFGRLDGKADLRGYSTDQHFGDTRTTSQVCADIAAAARRMAAAKPTPDHETLGDQVAEQLGFHPGAVSRFFRLAEEASLIRCGQEAALAQAGREPGQ